MISHSSVDSAELNGQFRALEGLVDAEITPLVTLTAERALLVALTEAAKAGRFDVVAQLAKELEARRLAASPNVVPLVGSKPGRSRS